MVCSVLQLALLAILAIAPAAGLVPQSKISQISREESLSSTTVLFAAQQSDDSVSSRRDLLIQSGGIALSSFLLGNPLPAVAAEPKTIVITGSNSGIGFEACKRLAAQGHNLVLACRTLQKAQEAADQLKAYCIGGNNNALIPAACDLTSLQSIDVFADQLPNLIGNGRKIDVLCLNAGIARNTAAKDCARTQDGFELTGKSKVCSIGQFA